MNHFHFLHSKIGLQVLRVSTKVGKVSEKSTILCPGLRRAIVGAPNLFGSYLSTYEALGPEPSTPSGPRCPTPHQPKMDWGRRGCPRVDFSGSGSQAPPRPLPGAGKGPPGIVQGPPGAGMGHPSRNLHSQSSVLSCPGANAEGPLLQLVI